MAKVAQSRATGPLFFLKTGCPNEILVTSGNRATGQPGNRLMRHPFKPHFFVIHIHFTPSPPSFTTPLPPTNVAVCFVKFFTAIIQHWMGGRGIFVKCSEVYKRVTIMAKKCHVESMCQLFLSLVVAMNILSRGNNIT